jgi:hypothetical protein
VKNLFVRLRRDKPVNAQVSISKIIDEFYEDFATEASGRYWWWCQMVLLDPNEIIVNDGDDNLYRVPFTIEATDEDDAGPGVTFGDPIPVAIQYVDIAARSEQAVAACAGIASIRGEKVAARYISRAESCPNRKEGGNMKELIAKLRARYNLPEDTPDEEVLRVAAESAPTGEPGEEPADAPAELQPEGQPGQGGDGEPEPGTVETEGGTAASTGTVNVDAAALEQLRQDAAAGRAARDQQIAETDERILAEAIKCGKFAPARKAHFAKLLKVDRQGTIETINGLEENVIPVKARGTTPENNEGSGGGSTGYPVTWLPEVAARKAAQASAEPQRVVMGGD